MICPTHRTVLILGMLACLPTSAANASLLTFETMPDGSNPADNAPLASPYAIAGGSVRFFFDLNGDDTFDPTADLYPAFERRGNDDVWGFINNFAGRHDTPRRGYDGALGEYFLRHPVSPFGTFIADYDTTVPIHELSGEIWDIDGVPEDGTTEGWRIDVLNGSNDVVASLLSPEYGDYSQENSLDGLPWTFQFHDLPAGVDKIRLTFVGTKTTGLGLGFNNFSPTVAVPEPSAILLVASGGLAMLLAHRRHGAGGRT